MTLLLQQLIEGISSGGIYAAMALSIVLVYRASGIINFAQGEMAMFGTFLVWQIWKIGVPLYLAVAIGIVLSAVAGALIERFLIRRFTTHLPPIIVTLGLMLVLNSLAGLFWGYQTKQFPALFGRGTVRFEDLSMSRQALGVVICVAVISGLLFLLLQRTFVGLALRATTSNRTSARLVGIRTGYMLMLGWALAAALGTVTGVLAAPILYLEPNMMAPLLLYAFAAAVLGGLRSPVGAIAGGLIIGVTENLIGTYVPWIGSDFKQAVAVALIMVVLFFKPAGLFDRRVVQRV